MATRRRNRFSLRDRRQQRRTKIVVKTVVEPDPKTEIYKNALLEMLNALYDEWETGPFRPDHSRSRQFKIVHEALGINS